MGFEVDKSKTFYARLLSVIKHERRAEAFYEYIRQQQIGVHSLGPLDQALYNKLDPEADVIEALNSFFEENELDTLAGLTEAEAISCSNGDIEYVKTLTEGMEKALNAVLEAELKPAQRDLEDLIQTLMMEHPIEPPPPPAKPVLTARRVDFSAAFTNQVVKRTPVDELISRVWHCLGQEQKLPDIIETIAGQPYTVSHEFEDYIDRRYANPGCTEIMDALRQGVLELPDRDPRKQPLLKAVHLDNFCPPSTSFSI